MSPSTYCSYVLCMQPASSSTIRCDVSPLSLPVVWLWECSIVRVRPTGEGYHGSGAIMLGLQRGKLAPTMVSGLGVFVPSWPCPVVRLYHESSFSSQSRDFLCFLHHRPRVLDRGSLWNVVHGTKGELAGINPAAWAAYSPQQRAGLAGWYTCVLLFAGVDLLSTPQKLCVVKAGRHGSHKRG